MQPKRNGFPKTCFPRFILKTCFSIEGSSSPPKNKAKILAPTQPPSPNLEGEPSHSLRPPGVRRIESGSDRKVCTIPKHAVTKLLGARCKVGQTTSYNWGEITHNSTCRGEITPVTLFIRPFIGVVISHVYNDRRGPPCGNKINFSDCLIKTRNLSRNWWKWSCTLLIVGIYPVEIVLAP